MERKNLISVREASEEKQCTAQTIYNALDRKQLTEFRVGNARLVIKDDRYVQFAVAETGGRLHKDSNL